jgi:prepilin-type N-terminal cleavage/methylation domain-containing protein
MKLGDSTPNCEDTTMFGRKRRGFVLAELLVVLVATGVAAAMAAPRLQKTVGQSRVRNAGTAIGNAVARAKIVATSRGCDAVVHINSGPAAEVWLTTCKRSGSGVDTLKTDRIGAAYKVTVATAADSIAFSPVGTRTGRETTVVTISEASGGYTDSLTIDPLGGVKRSR